MSPYLSLGRAEEANAPPPQRQNNPKTAAHRTIKEFTVFFQQNEYSEHVHPRNVSEKSVFYKKTESHDLELSPKKLEITN